MNADRLKYSAGLTVHLRESAESAFICVPSLDYGYMR